MTIEAAAYLAEYYVVCVEIGRVIAQMIGG